MPPKKLSRNAPCPCGSGRKYKHCCYGKGVEDDDLLSGWIQKAMKFVGTLPAK